MGEIIRGNLQRPTAGCFVGVVAFACFFGQLAHTGLADLRATPIEQVESGKRVVSINHDSSRERRVSVDNFSIVRDIFDVSYDSE